jgi:alkylation response protein AidB-like acyl-CoA dehydrogenase
MTLILDEDTAVFDHTIREARDRATEGERRRALAPEVVAAARESGLFCLTLPRRLGGLELDPLATIDVLERLSHADGAAGWCGFIGNATSFFGWLDPDVAAGLLAGAPRVAASSVFAPGGRAVSDGPGTYRVDGRWTFASGSTHSDWIQLGVMVATDGGVDWRFAYVPTAEVEIVDTWHTLGLRATASHDIVADGVRVPAEHMAMPLFDEPRSDAPIYRLGFWGLGAVLMAPFPLGVARRAVDELVAGLPDRRTRPGQVPPADDPQVHHELGRATTSLRAARAMLDDAAGRAWDTAVAGDPLGEPELRNLGLALQHAMTTARSVVSTAYGLAGSAVVYDGDPIGRCYRDLATAAKHVVFGPDGYRAPGRALAGRP